MRWSTNCKVCKLPITVTIDDGYVDLGDPYKLLEKATCNPCIDLRDLRYKLEGALERVCDRIFKRGRMSEETRQAHREGLTNLTKRYAEMIAKVHRREGMCWDESVVESLLDNPRRWGEIVGRLWKLYRQWERDQAQEEAQGQLPCSAERDQ